MYFIKALRGPPPSAVVQGPLKDGGGRWMADMWPWRKAVNGEDD